MFVPTSACKRSSTGSSRASTNCIPAAHAGSRSCAGAATEIRTGAHRRDQRNHPCCDAHQGQGGSGHEVDPLRPAAHDDRPGRRATSTIFPTPIADAPSWRSAWPDRAAIDQMMWRTLKEEGVPQDLIYLAQAESGFHPLAFSRVGARGIWQFMAGRGRGYGLHRNMWVDDRQDPEKSTRAAARHLKDLYNSSATGTWPWPPTTRGRARYSARSKRTGYADFWELYRRNVLPGRRAITFQSFVAVTIMAKNPSQYGLDERGDGKSGRLRHGHASTTRLTFGWCPIAWDDDRRTAGSESKPVAHERPLAPEVRTAHAGRD